MEMKNCCMAVKKNIRPMSTPTVLIEAWSNCRITAEIPTQKTPNTIHSHHNLAMPCSAWRSGVVSELSISVLP